jgi:hypothetical protein
MATTDYGKEKYCGTCAYWGGEREVIDSGKKARVVYTGSAPCLGKNKGQNKTANSSCSGWERWALIKR